MSSLLIEKQTRKETITNKVNDTTEVKYTILGEYSRSLKSLF